MQASIFFATLGLQAAATQAHPHLTARVDKDPTQLGALPNQYLVSDPSIPTNELHLYNVYGPSVLYLFGTYIDPEGRIQTRIPYVMGAVFPNPENGTDNQGIVDMIVENVDSLKFEGDQTPNVQKAWFAQIADSSPHAEDGNTTTLIDRLSAALMPVNVNFPATFPATPYLLGSPNPLSNLSAYVGSAGFSAYINDIPSVVTELYG